MKNFSEINIFLIIYTVSFYYNSYINYQMFAKLLFFSIPISLVGFKEYSGEETPLYLLILGTQFLCVLNLLIMNKRLQLLLHDLFVYVLTYGLLCSNNHFTKIFSIVIGSTMLLTRMYYKRCIFLFWNATRNIDYDFVVLSMILACFFRQDCLLGNKECMAVGFFSHFLLDKYENSFIKKFIIV